MDTKLTEEELTDIVYAEDKEILEVMEQSNNESKSSTDLDQEQEVSNNAIWYHNLETEENYDTVSTLGWDKYYDSDDWSDYESFNRQVQLERMWNDMEEEKEDNCSIQSSSDDINTDSNNSLDDEEYNWEEMLGSGYWDSNGGSPQWVPVESNELGLNDDLSIQY